jgi:acyl-CoA synthetase (NDP forming)
VVLTKVGRTAEGSAAAASHTASLTGEDEVYEALFRQYGVHRADTTDELLDIAYAVTRNQVPRGRRVGVISMSGGVGVQISDYIGDAGLKLGEVPQEVQDKLRALVPNCSPRNPIDMTGLVTTDAHIMQETATLTLGADAFDAIVIFLGITGSAPSMAVPMQEALTAAVKAHPGRLILLSITAPPEMQAEYDKLGFLVFEDPSRAVKVLSALVRFQENFDRPPIERPAPFDVPLAWPTGGRFNEAQAKALVAACGVRSPRETLVQTPEEAAAAAAEIGGPVAVKVVSADIAHKTEVGGVALGLSTPEAAAEAVARMAQVVPARSPGAVIDGYLISEMVSGGVECIIGAHRDPALGPVVTFGLGGVLVELLKDTTCRLAPVGEAEAAAMIGEIKAAPLLTGYRGGPRYDVAALARAISAISRLVASHCDHIDSLEVNPAVVLPEGQGVVALDAVVQPPRARA